MSTTREARGSEVFRFTCDDCDTVLRVSATTGFGAARTAAGKGWTFHRLDRCGRCTKAATPKRKPAAKR